MSLSPLDIANHEFSRTLRGYDPQEVRAFLERLSDEVHASRMRIAELTKHNAAIEAKLDALGGVEKNVRDSVVPQDSMNSARTQIEQEREQMQREAQAEAEELRFAAQREVAAMREDLRGLKLQREGYVKRFRFLIKSQVELLDLLETETSNTADARVEKPTH